MPDMATGKQIRNDDIRVVKCREAKALAGGPSALASKLGIAPQAVSKWRIVPPRRVLEVEELSGVSRHLLRPDIYGGVPRGGSVPVESQSAIAGVS
jgi:DNA-binding transcriptional regulator YdaS (Cro superfamily)